MFQPMVEKLLNIEQFLIEYYCKSKLKIIGEFWHALGIIGKPLMTKIQ